MALVPFTNNALFAAKPIVKKPILPSITENLYGPTVQTTSDGTRIIDNQDGSTVKIYPDGSIFITNCDGTTLTSAAN